jgi:hypothetical protein
LCLSCRVCLFLCTFSCGVQEKVRKERRPKRGFGTSHSLLSESLSVSAWNTNTTRFHRAVSVSKHLQTDYEPPLWQLSPKRYPTTITQSWWMIGIHSSPILDLCEGI